MTRVPIRRRSILKGNPLREPLSDTRNGWRYALHVKPMFRQAHVSVVSAVARSRDDAVYTQDPVEHNGDAAPKQGLLSLLRMRRNCVSLQHERWVELRVPPPRLR